jgi:hypothetical protein
LSSCGYNRELTLFVLCSYNVKSPQPIEIGAMLRKKRNPIAAGSLIAFSALFVAHAPDARADSASCLAKATSFVVDLDELLSRERNWNTPYFDLIERYFPLRDCEVTPCWTSPEGRALFDRFPTVPANILSFSQVEMHTPDSPM